MVNTSISNITLAGKSAPEATQLDRVESQGFDNIELYVEPAHLENPSQSVNKVNQYDLDVVSVHTPHVSIEESDLLKLSDKLAIEFGAYLVVHSNRIITTCTSELERLNFQSPYGYESNPGVSGRHIRNLILNPGHNFVLDTAHLFMAEEDYVTSMEQLLREYSNQIQIVHLCDATLTQDGLGFGDGVMDLENVFQILLEHFQGTVVLEVEGKSQLEARRQLEDFWATH